VTIKLAALYGALLMLVATLVGVVAHGPTWLVACNGFLAAFLCWVASKA
jgi:hypothetical protein